MGDGPAQGLCRDCLAPVAAADAATRCPSCGSARLVRHDEIASLTLAHIDCDAFYASVEKRDDPSLADKALIVGGGRRGVVLTACYNARKFGVRSAMPMFQALKLCPHATVVRPNMAKYAGVSRQVRAIFLSATPIVESVSLDEAYLDLSGTEKLHGRTPAATLADIARRVEAELGITVSIGLSWSRFLAKLASELDKPRGFGVIGRAEAQALLAKRPVRVIPGIGPKLEARLVEAGYRTIGDLQRVPAADLRRQFGNLGLWLAERAFGRGSDVVEPDREAKGVSAETTFATDLVGAEALARELWPLCERVSERLKKANLAGSSVVLKLKRADFRIVTRRRHLADPTQRAEQIWQVARALLDAAAGRAAWRLIGVGVVDIVEGRAADQPDLFDGLAQPGAPRVKPAVEDALDAVRAKFGDDAITLGRSLPVPETVHRPRRK